MDEGYTLECKKDALRQMQDGGIKVTFTINPVDMPAELYADPMGQRYMMVIVPIGDDEKPIPKQVKLKSYAGEGKLLAQEAALKKYRLSIPLLSVSIDTERIADMETWMKAMISIKSCSELVENSPAFERFKAFREDFYSWKRAQEQEQYYGR